MSEGRAWVDLGSDDERSLLIALVGYRFGREPEQRVADIRAERAAYMRKFIRMARIRPGHTVLELGSGCGFGTRVLAGAAGRVIACDISPAYLSYARRELAGVDNVELRRIPPFDLSGIEAQSIDRVVSTSVFIHLNAYDIYIYFKEFIRIIRNKARIVFDFADVHRLARGRWSFGLDEQFLEHVAFYRDNPTSLPGLVQWNSARGIRGVARLAGFRQVSRRGHRLAFTRRKGQ